MEWLPLLVTKDLVELLIKSWVVASFEASYLPTGASMGPISLSWPMNGHSHPSSLEPVAVCRPFTAPPRVRTPDPRGFMERRSRLLRTYRRIMAWPAACFAHLVNAWISIGGRSSDLMSGCWLSSSLLKYYLSLFNTATIEYETSCLQDARYQAQRFWAGMGSFILASASSTSLSIEFDSIISSYPDLDSNFRGPCVLKIWRFFFRDLVENYFKLMKFLAV